MEFFLFDVVENRELIDSFLSGASLAHKEPLRSLDWFLWKFGNNTNGKAVLACARENNVIAGCVGFGLIDFYADNKIIKGAISYETFVNPKFQGKGLFKKLIDYAEKKMTEMGIQLLINFPNNNSLPGFKRMGWIQYYPSKYLLKICHFFKVLMNYKDLRKGFIPMESNFDELKAGDMFVYKQVYAKENNIVQIVSKDYLKWRFYTFPVSKYIVVDDEEFYSIARLGNRGKIVELQILFVNPKNEKYSIAHLLKTYKRKCSFDIVGVSISKECYLYKSYKKNLFLSVPHHGHECYKLLDESLVVDLEKIDFQGLMAHTY